MTTLEEYNIRAEFAAELKTETIEAYKEALRRYPNDVKGALIFFVSALGLTLAKITAEDMERTIEIVSKVEN